MRKEDITIGKTVYLLFPDGKLLQDEVCGQYVSHGMINCNLSKLKNTSNSCWFTFKDGEEADGRHEYNYNQANTFKVYLSKQEAAEAQRQAIIKHVGKLKSAVQRAFTDLQEYRKKYHEVLNSTDVREWVQNFHRENQW